MMFRLLLWAVLTMGHTHTSLSLVLPEQQKVLQQFQDAY